MKPFFILSLPRSRTAWLANLLTHGPAFCYHEALGYVKAMKHLKRLFEHTGPEFVGTADSGATFFADSILRHFPGAPIILIRRDRKEVADSLRRAGIPFTLDALAAADRRLDRLADSGAHSFDFEALDDPGTCGRIWRLCAPGHPFNLFRWEMLSDLQVQMLPRSIPAKMDAMRGNIEALIASEGGITL